MKDLVIVATGGAIGSVSRYMIQKLLLAISTLSFPFGTLAVNILGCFLIGIIWALKDRSGISEVTSLFLMTGFCGGFTTFSAFSAESVEMLAQNRFLPFISYVSLSVIAGVSATWFGYYLTK